MSIIEDLKSNERPFGLMSEEMQAKAEELGLYHNFRKWTGSHTAGWGGVFNATGCKFKRDTAYRLRPDYQEEPKWSERVFASTTDSEKDSMNNIVGVTAHCMCGNVFCDDVVHGKLQAKPKIEFYENIIFKVQGVLTTNYYYNDRISLEEALRKPDFAGLVYEKGKHEVLTLTHVLFRKANP